MSKILSIALLLLSAAVVADDYYKIVKIECDPNKNLYKIDSFGVYNVIDKKGNPDGKWGAVVVKGSLKEGNINYYKAETISNVCVLNKTKIDVDIEYAEARASGMCGADPSASLDLYVNGTLTISGTFNACDSYISIHEITRVTDDKWKVCVGKAYDNTEKCAVVDHLNTNSMFKIYEN